MATLTPKPLTGYFVCLQFDDRSDTGHWLFAVDTSMRATEHWTQYAANATVFRTEEEAILFLEDCPFPAFIATEEFVAFEYALKPINDNARLHLVHLS